MVANILPTDLPPNDPRGQKVRFNFFQNMVMLHIKLKGITNAATWYQIFCPQTPDPGGGVKIQNFQNMVMLFIKLKGMQQHSVRRPPPPHTHTHILTQTPTTLGSKSQNSTFSEHGHVAYQIKGNHECSMVKNILTADPGLWGWGQKVTIQLMQNKVMLHIKLKGITNAATGSKYFARRPPS